MGKTWVLHNSAQKTSAALCVYDISAVFRQLTRIHRKYLACKCGEVFGGAVRLRNQCPG